MKEKKLDQGGETTKSSCLHKFGVWMQIKKQNEKE